MNICKFFQYFVIFTLLCFSSITVAQSNNFENLKDGQEAFNSGYYLQAFKIWHTQALAGDAGAQMLVGLAFRNGWGVAKDSNQAILWYKMSAEQQNTAAQFLLGLALLASENSEDVAAGIMWLHKAAEGGDQEASKFLTKAKQKNWFAVSDKLKTKVTTKDTTTPKPSQPGKTDKPATISSTGPNKTQVVSQVVLN